MKIDVTVGKYAFYSKENYQLKVKNDVTVGKYTLQSKENYQLKVKNDVIVGNTISSLSKIANQEY